MPAQEGPPVKLSARGAPTPMENKTNLVEARQSLGFITVKEWLADAVTRRATRVILDFTRSGISVRYQIDGLWHSLPGREREAGDLGLMVMKKLCNLNPKERRAKQEGELAARFHQVEFTVKLASQGTKDGERVLMEIVGIKDEFESMEELGMREKMQEQFKELLGETSGLIVFSALPAGGLTTSLQVGLRGTDRYMRDFMAIVDSSKPSFPYVENIESTEYDSSKGESPDQIMKQVMLKQPDVMVVPELENAVTFNLLLQEILEDEKLVITTLRAKDSVEALMRLMSYKPNTELLSQAIKGVLGQRLIRKLCLSCRRPFKPNPQLLQKLGLPADGRIQALYRPFNAKTDRGEDGKELPACEICGGLGYRERTAVFELLTPGDGMRHAMVHQPRLDALRAIAKQERHRGLLEEGLFHVIKGTTSLNELQRILQT